MKTIKGYVNTRNVGSRCTFETEVEDDATEAEIEEAAREAMFEQIEWGFEIEDAS